MAELQRRERRRIAFVGSCLPCMCGIATYTEDLRRGLESFDGTTEFIQVALPDTITGYHYDSQVRFEIGEKENSAYRRAADFLNINDIQVVNLQHEFGFSAAPPVAM